MNAYSRPISALREDAIPTRPRPLAEQKLDLPVLAALLAVAVFIGLVSVAAGTRWGLMWGIGAACLSWGALSAIALVCVCAAHARCVE